MYCIWPIIPIQYVRTQRLNSTHRSWIRTTKWKPELSMAGNDWSEIIETRNALISEGQHTRYISLQVSKKSLFWYKLLRATKKGTHDWTIAQPRLERIKQQEQFYIGTYIVSLNKGGPEIIWIREPTRTMFAGREFKYTNFKQISKLIKNWGFARLAKTCQNMLQVEAYQGMEHFPEGKLIAPPWWLLAVLTGYVIYPCARNCRQSHLSPKTIISLSKKTSTLG